MALSPDLTIGFLAQGKLLLVLRNSSGSLPGGLAQSWVNRDEVWTRGALLVF